MRAPAALAVLLAAGCVPEEGPLMAPGQDCLQCHGGGDARRWTAAGTWRKGARIAIADANGKSFTLRGNDAGNFYTAESLAFPLQVSVDGAPMPDPVTYGGCNLCHGPGGTTLAAELMAPGRDCLPCHDGGLAKRFSAAGTFLPAGATVVVGGQTRTANPVGNFFIEEPLGFPAPVAASVNGSQMNPPPTYGGCNACHGSGEGGDG